MKLFYATTLLLAVCALVSCGGGGNTDQIVGSWTLSGYTNAGEAVELSDCDAQTKWNFSSEAGEALQDGTSTMKLSAGAPDNCQYYGFDATWTTQGSKLFISTSRIGGMGGSSFAGLMEIVELTPNKLVVKSMKRELTFTR